MIHAYAICEPATASFVAGRGLQGARLRTVDSEGLAAVFSHHRSLETSPELVMGHEKVIENLMVNGAVLPLRFGNRLQSETELVEALAARHDELVRAIERVRGHVEIGLRVIPRETEDRPQGDRAERLSGRAYLMERVSEHRLAERARREIHLPLATLAKAEVLASRIAPPAILAASYLVADGEVEHFRARAQALAAGIAEVQSFVTGPWPPYSFVDLRERPSEESQRGQP